MRKVSNVMSRWLVLVLFVSCAAVAAVAAVAADAPVPGASDERQAREALPSGGKALLYIYRKQDGGETPVAVSLNGTEVAKLVPRTFGLWNVASGRTEIRVAGKVLAVQSEAGRIYFIEVTHSPVDTSLRQVSYSVGRQQTHNATLVSKQTGSPAPASQKTQPKEPPAKKETSAKRPPAKKPVRARAAAPRDKFVLSLKVGLPTLASASQTILSVDRSFDDSASALGIEGEAFVNPHFSVSGEFIRYSNSFTTEGTGVEGEITTSVYLANVKYYFTDDDNEWRPYAGAGLGAATVDFSGALTGSTGGVAMQAFGGVLWRYNDNIGVRGEYKVIRSDTEDDSGNGIDVSANGIFVGVTLHF
jgi:hypothetical protein